MFKLSIIVPADGPQESLDSTLLTVLENRPADCQVIVPHPPTYHDPYDLGDEVHFAPTETAGLASLINTAIEASESEIVHVLLGGTLARDGWTDAALRQFDEQPDVAAIAPAVLRPDNGKRLSAAGIRYGRGGKKCVVAAGRRPKADTSKQPTVDGPVLQAAFFRKSVLMQLGGLRDEFGRFHIDTDLAARLRASDRVCLHEPASQVSSWIPRSPQGFRAARHAELLYWCHARSLRQRGALSCHTLHVAVDVLRQLPRPSVLTALLGRSCGFPQGAMGWGPQPMADHVDSDHPVSISLDAVRNQAGRNQPSDVESRESARRHSRSA